jgi:predicted RND superfamily exporter protein
VTRLKLIAIAIVIVVFFTGATMLRFQRNQIKNLKRDLVQVQTLADKSKHTATTYINLHGREVSKNRVLDLSLRNARELRKLEELNYINQFASIKKNLSNLQQVVLVQASAITSLRLKNTDTLIITKTDTIKASKFRYADPYNFLAGHTTKDSTYIDSARSDLSLEGAIILGKRTKKFLFFRVGPRATESHLTSPNPWVKITDQQFIKIEKR